MTLIRPPAVAGTFYPGDARRLRTTVEALLAAVPQGPETTPPVALVVPHAGYVYSGPVAATAYAQLRPFAGGIRRVVVVGPPHRVPVRGLALSSADAFRTPLGDVPLDLDGRDLLLDQPHVYVDDRAHAPEHSVEVHVPFLQCVLPEGAWTLLPALAGDAPAGTVADALEPVWGAPDTLVVISTDLSHYHDLATARRIDRGTAEAIVAGRWGSLGGEQACGVVGVRGALELARRHGEAATLLDLRTSGDTAGPDDRVVGYGSFAVR